MGQALVLQFLAWDALQGQLILQGDYEEERLFRGHVRGVQLCLFAVLSCCIRSFQATVTKLREFPMIVQHDRTAYAQRRFVCQINMSGIIALVWYRWGSPPVYEVQIVHGLFCFRKFSLTLKRSPINWHILLQLPSDKQCTRVQSRLRPRCDRTKLEATAAYACYFILL